MSDILPSTSQLLQYHELQISIQSCGVGQISATIIDSAKFNKTGRATGSRTCVPPIPGHDIPGIFTFRNFDDVEKLLACSFSSRRCIVVGGGLLDLEAARGMVDRGVETWVIEHGAHLMARLLDVRAGRHLQTGTNDNAGRVANVPRNFTQNASLARKQETFRMGNKQFRNNC